MQGAFITYLKLGIGHITDIQAYDHMLFLLALCAVYTFAQRTKVFWLVTAFTIGHSITLALSALNIVKVNSDLIEILIPVTIMLTAILNIIEVRKRNQKKTFANIWLIKYIVVVCFGFIHGMGFSNYFKALLGEATNIVKFLFAFNVGVEIGQIMIVIVILLISWMMMNLFRVKQKIWNYMVSTLAFLLSGYLIFQLIIG